MLENAGYVQKIHSSVWTNLSKKYCASTVEIDISLSTTHHKITRMNIDLLHKSLSAALLGGWSYS